MAENEKYVDGLTEAESEDMAIIVSKTINEICLFSDKHNIDRDSMLKYFADMLTAFAEVASIQDYKFNHTHSDRIRNMSDEELAEFLDIVGEDGISSQYADVPCDCCCEKTECSKCWKEWLQSEAE